MTITFSLWVWALIFGMSVLWTWFTRSIPADHYNEWWEQLLKLIITYAGVAFIIISIYGFFSQHVTLK